MIRHLEPLGWDAEVLTTSVWGREPGEAAEGVHRTGDLVASPVLRRALGRGAVARAPATPAAEVAPPPALLRHIVPEATAASWLPPAVPRARRLVRGGRFDAVITTSPPESAHIAALLLGRTRPAWVADLRDPWITPGLREPFPTRAQRALDRRLERTVVRVADAVVAVHEATAADLERRHGRPVSVVPNGWDPANAGAVVPVPADTEAFTIVHTGSMASVPGRDPRAFLRAVERVASEPGSRHVRLVLAGSRSAADHELLAAAREGVVDHRGTIAYGEALGLQRVADLLVVLATEQPTAAPAKLYEYLAAERPVLVLGAGSESARIVQATGAGVAVPLSDESAIVDVLRRARAGMLRVEPDAEALDNYRYPHLAERMAEVLDGAMAAAGRRRGPR
jgi:hypothetical protein